MFAVTGECRDRLNGGTKGCTLPGMPMPALDFLSKGGAGLIGRIAEARELHFHFVR